ncbi:AP-5 complex subunit mu-1-like [Oppia nitens]|uniref:AP-5 complex subunit mu-1-like n=1 Tax=Oppia nitens TaxID=1686743 RepID=UPI0023DB7AE7|nr:AP-5 complex subunit mu-1-like [Oppia nitens]
MALRYFWIISLTTKSVVFLRRFPTVEKRAQNFGHKEVIITGDDLLVDAMLTSLAINRVTDDEAFQLSSRNELPVVGLKYKDNNLWPILVIEQNGFLFCGFPFCESHPKSDTIELIDDKSIALCFTCLQTIARYFTADKGLSWIEWLITSMAPFGTLINQNYEPLNQKKQTGGQRVNKLETKLQQNELKLSVNELISRTKDKELIYGTLTIDHPNHNYNGLVNVKLRAIDSLNLVLPPNCTQNGFILQIRPAYHNPLHLVHYKCNSNNKS